MQTYTNKQLKFLRSAYARMPIRDLTPAFNAKFRTKKTEVQIKSTLKNHNITCGRDGRFKKGYVSWNKGVKGYIGANRTSFRKGHKPANRKPLGTERIDSKNGHLLVKVKERDPYTGFPTRYKAKHVHIWEMAHGHGPVPKGFVVAFKDGNNRKCRIENLMLISRAELLTLNRSEYKKMPAKLKPSVLILSRLKARTHALLRANEGKTKNP